MNTALELSDIQASAEAHIAQEAEAFFRALGERLKPDDLQLIRHAYSFSAASHSGQFRKSGEPYISHPLAVAQILTSWFCDPQAIAAALLHDVMEDTGVSKLELINHFGRQVAELVDGLSKLDRIEFQSREEAQAENFRKMLLAMARDIRVILVKLADRLHNMRTLEAMHEDKRRRIALETQEIYAPIANRIGMNNVYQELDDLCFRHLHPNRHQVLAKAVKAARGNRREIVQKITQAVEQRLADHGIRAVVQGREKHLHSIYTKMQEKHLSFSEVLDIYGFRVQVDTVSACYLAVGALHSLYKPIPGKFKDYIAIPKANGYQSLHTTLFGPYGPPIEVQIRTHEMHLIAETGIASHWLYKNGEEMMNEVQQRAHQWLQRLLEIQSQSGDASEFLEHIKVDLFPDEVYVFTPKGQILSLPHGATAVDFAYAVHTDIGNRCVATKINGELVPLRTQLKNGDRVEIITAPNSHPNPTWLNIVITGKARSHIRHYLKTLHYSEAVELGQRLLEQALQTLHHPSQSFEEDVWDRLQRETGLKTRDELLSDLGLGKRLALVVARRLLALSGMMPSESELHTPIVIRGTEGMAVNYARCCCPIPGDPIIGIIKKGQGLVIHTHDCHNISKNRSEQERWLDVTWAPDTKKLFSVNIKVVAQNQRGVLAKVAAAISEASSNIENVNMDERDSGDAYTTLRFTLQVENRLHLAQVMRALRQLDVVTRIIRYRNDL